MKVLLLDPTRSDIGDVVKMGEKIGLTVDTCNTIAQMGTAVRDRQYDVLLVNITDRQGLEAVGAVCKDGPELPVIVMTAARNQKAAAAALSHGAHDYLVTENCTSETLAHCLEIAEARLVARHTIEQRTLLDAVRERFVELDKNLAEVQMCMDDHLNHPSSASRSPGESCSRCTSPTSLGTPH